ncbi:Splicing factor-like protein [Parasponia andersonii]|uniref:Splicing factor-like protein n=1 Tax=Parasponia andersonii TaxID=3476 RepID=A0A2P5CZC4_PARAD|nr:Splicing factor-like protein [Parasponia andersonii]
MDDEPEFKWGRRRGVGERYEDIQYYESFTYGGIEYSLYDSVCFYCAGSPETYIGKLVKLYEITPTHEKKVRVVWFFRPTEIRNHLGDVEPHWNELLLASGQGNGLSNINYAEAVIAKCNVICTSKDRRNPQASEEELRRAHYVFHRTFNVDNNEISDKFPEEIGGIKVEFFFNKKKYQQNQSQPSLKAKQPSQPFTESPRSDLSKGVDSPAKYPKPPGRNDSLVKESERGTSKATVVERGCGSSDTANLKRLPVEGGNKPGIHVKDKSRVRTSEMISPQNTSDTRPYKKKMTVLNIKGPTIHKGGPNKGEDFGVKATSKTFEKAGTQLAHDKSAKTNNQVLEVTKRPDADRRNWFKQLPWEEKLQKAQEAETLVLLENLDPSFSSVEVEELIWHAFHEKVEARMTQFISTFSKPLYGKAFVIFKSKAAAQSAVCELNSKYLVLDDGRPVVGRYRNLRVSDKATSFPGHLVLDRFRLQKQREEMRNAVSTAHCSQSNTVEFEMAMEWRILQEKSNLWWKDLYENHSKSITEARSRLKLNRGNFVAFYCYFRVESHEGGL